VLGQGVETHSLELLSEFGVVGSSFGQNQFVGRDKSQVDYCLVDGEEAALFFVLHPFSELSGMLEQELSLLLGNDARDIVALVSGQCLEGLDGVGWRQHYRALDGIVDADLIPALRDLKVVAIVGNDRKVFALQIGYQGQDHIVSLEGGMSHQRNRQILQALQNGVLGELKAFGLLDGLGSLLHDPISLVFGVEVFAELGIAFQHSEDLMRLKLLNQGAQGAEEVEHRHITSIHALFWGVLEGYLGAPAQEEKVKEENAICHKRTISVVDVAALWANLWVIRLGYLPQGYLIFDQGIGGVFAVSDELAILTCVERPDKQGAANWADLRHIDADQVLLGKPMGARDIVSLNQKGLGLGHR
jgi:hypothetical protein